MSSPRSPAVALALAILLGACSVAPPVTSAVATAPDGRSGVGFASVADARQALAARSDVKAFTRGGYDVFSDKANQILWQFTRPGHAAYPSVVRRQVVNDGQRTYLRSNVLCQADAAVCDLLRENTRLMDAQIMQHLHEDDGAAQRPASALPPEPRPTRPGASEVRT